LPRMAQQMNRGRVQPVRDLQPKCFFRTRHTPQLSMANDSGSSPTSRSISLANILLDNLA
jgi:hypothetical protein